MEKFCKEKIIDLINNKKESEICDFKREWYSNNEDLIKDIICFANTVHNEDCYLVLGVEDKYKNIVGVENDSKRMSQAEVIDILQSLSFAEAVPSVSVNSFVIEEHTIDVITIENLQKTPVYLTKKYGKSLFPANIYTRVGDRNTPSNETADPVTIENLWKKRFWLLDTYTDKYIRYLRNAEDWKRIEVADDYTEFYFIPDPEFKVRLVHDSEQKQSFFSSVCLNPEYYNEYFQIFYKNQLVHKELLGSFDDFRFKALIPELRVMCLNSGKEIVYAYLIFSEIKKSVELFVNTHYPSSSQFAKSDYAELISVFEKKEDIDLFDLFLKEHEEALLQAFKNKIVCADDYELNAKTSAAVRDLSLKFKEERKDI